MSDGEWLDVAAAAKRHECSNDLIRRLVKQGVLSARTERGRGKMEVL